MLLCRGAMDELCNDNTLKFGDCKNSSLSDNFDFIDLLDFEGFISEVETTTNQNVANGNFQLQNFGIADITTTLNRQILPVLYFSESKPTTALIAPNIYEPYANGSSEVLHYVSCKRKKLRSEAMFEPKSQLQSEMELKPSVLIPSLVSQLVLHLINDNRLQIAQFILKYCDRDCELHSEELNGPIKGRVAIMCYFTLMCDYYPDGLYLASKDEISLSQADQSIQSKSYTLTASKVFELSFVNSFHQLLNYWNSIYQSSQRFNSPDSSEHELIPAIAQKGWSFDCTRFQQKAAQFISKPDGTRFNSWYASSSSSSPSITQQPLPLGFQSFKEFASTLRQHQSVDSDATISPTNADSTFVQTHIQSTNPCTPVERQLDLTVSTNEIFSAAEAESILSSLKSEVPKSKPSTIKKTIELTIKSVLLPDTAAQSTNLSASVSDHSTNNQTSIVQNSISVASSPIIRCIVIRDT